MTRLETGGRIPLSVERVARPSKPARVGDGDSGAQTPDRSGKRLAQQLETRPNDPPRAASAAADSRRGANLRADDPARAEPARPKVRFRAPDAKDPGAQVFLHENQREVRAAKPIVDPLPAPAPAQRPEPTAPPPASAAELRATPAEVGTEVVQARADRSAEAPPAERGGGVYDVRGQSAAEQPETGRIVDVSA